MQSGLQGICEILGPGYVEGRPPWVGAGDKVGFGVHAWLVPVIVGISVFFPVPDSDIFVYF